MDGLAAGEHRDEVLDAPGPCVASLGAVDPVEHRVTVLTGKQLKIGLGSGLGGQGCGQVGGYLDCLLAWIGGLPAAVRLGPLTAARPAGCIRPSASSRSTIPTLRSDHWLRVRRGVKRWR